ncbi:DgaE family pyridoxal phosphate-dependent ammonia lyase [Companilactobacillus paralimentarius]|uniref:DgaE family pyridoxal phosphate-dependent ammonia lyase n=1 Tax=Companilactobacillus paralimentarius TaxID=83526 RepID=UPI0028535C27|nr:DgaE family pyridoxal phosphate-dependent ammonia lyase [Companilactobacillus paralimentarius]MDR4932907.1 DgaE family pyridoxal phosphate-dependent ammonia lyase [Companilactobacillus paralimentarius]
MDIYEKYNLKHVINADGKMTILGVSKVSDEVVEAQKLGAQNFFEMADLSVQTGKYLAKLIGSEDALVVNSASAGIAETIAGIIGQGSEYHLYHPYTEKITKREVILPMGHDVDYGTPVDVMLGVAGAKMVQAGYANMCKPEHIEMQINDQTAAVLYIKSHHTVQKSMLSISEAIEVVHRHNLPLVLDAAAEEDMFKYIKMGADVVIYSGAKAIEGPASGAIFGKEKYIKWARMQGAGIGRCMKIGKENIIGLTTAITKYLEEGTETGEQMIQRLEPFVKDLSELPDVEVKIVQDGAGRDIYRADVKPTGKLTAKEICDQLRNGQVAIYAREYRVNEGIIEFDIRSVDSEEMKQIISRLKEILGGK